MKVCTCTCSYMQAHSVAMCTDVQLSVHVSVGDTIQSVNGHSVNLDNIDSILAGLSNEVCNSLLY